MTPEQISNFVLGFLMMRGKPTEDGSLSATLIIECQEADKPSNFTLLWSTEHTRPDGVIDINRIRIWTRDRLLFDAEFLDSEFDTGNGRYRVAAFVTDESARYRSIYGSSKGEERAYLRKIGLGT